MRKIALQVEHKFKNRVVGSHLFQGEATIGSSRQADIRLLGDEVAGIHAAFDLNEGKWTLCDLGSTSGTWVNKKPVIEQLIDGGAIFERAVHSLPVKGHDRMRRVA